jgi:hypothetical protein
MHKVMLHHQGHDQVLFVQKFIDGLKHEIRNAIMFHKPRTVDAAMSLAIMQEEVLEASVRRYSPKHSRYYTKFQAKQLVREEKGILHSPLVTEAKVEDKAQSREKFKDRLSNLKAMSKGRMLQNGAPTISAPRMFLYMSWKSYLKSSSYLQREKTCLIVTLIVMLNCYPYQFVLWQEQMTRKQSGYMVCVGSKNY